MKLKILLPAEVFLVEEVSKVVAEADNGFFCLLPHHVDFTASLVPGVFAYPLIRLREVGSLFTLLFTLGSLGGICSGGCQVSFGEASSLHVFFRLVCDSGSGRLSISFRSVCIRPFLAPTTPLSAQVLACNVSLRRSL